MQEICEHCLFHHAVHGKRRTSSCSIATRQCISGTPEQTKTPDITVGCCANTATTITNFRPSTKKKNEMSSTLPCSQFFRDQTKKNGDVNFLEVRLFGRSTNNYIP
jgi:hypothetical protein